MPRGSWRYRGFAMGWVTRSTTNIMASKLVIDRLFVITSTTFICGPNSCGICGVGGVGHVQEV